MSDKPFASRSDPESRRAYTRWHYQKNKDAYKVRARIHRDKTRNSVRRFLMEYLLEHPCLDCGESDPVVLEFDHREGSEKLFNIGEACRRSVAISTLRAEVEKCDVRCANCHRRATYRRAGFTHRDISS